ncbi:MAG: methyltransferase, partial [Saprospiraceae bacterium]|nr:methyltransferase [Saprospiraceae bacterium]
MRRFFQLFWLPAYRAWALRYIRRERLFQYDGLRLRVPAGVFHPGIFFSTPIFLNFIKTLDLRQKTALDLGAGSGALALLATRLGARVTALDINPLAVKTTKENARDNGLILDMLQSDLFDALPTQRFDHIFVNPPYYSKAPQTDFERAFLAGPQLEYFEKLFRQMPGYLAVPGGRCWM